MIVLPDGRRVHTNETKFRIAVKKRGVPSRPSVVEKIANSNRGKKRSEETKQRMSEAQKRYHAEYPISDEQREKMRRAHLGVPLSEEHKKAILAGRNYSFETRYKMGSSNRGKRLSNDHKRHAAKGQSDFLRKHLTPREKLVKSALRKLGIKHRSQVAFGIYIADFYLPDLNTVLECNGYWHTRPHMKRRDLRKRLFLEGLGLKTAVVLVNKDIEDFDPLQSVKEALSL
jgi:very-short-patch-repair endonuclease